MGIVQGLSRNFAGLVRREMSKAGASQAATNGLREVARQVAHNSDHVVLGRRFFPQGNITKTDLSVMRWIRNVIPGFRPSLEGAQMVGARMPHADLAKFNLKGTYLVDADLRGANFKDAIMHRAKLDGADLRGANLNAAGEHEGLSLRGADLRDTPLFDLRKVTVDGARVVNRRLDKPGGTVIGESEKSLRNFWDLPSRAHRKNP